MKTTKAHTTKVTLAMPSVLVDHLKRLAREQAARDGADVKWTDLVRLTLGKQYRVMMDLDGGKR